MSQENGEKKREIELLIQTKKFALGAFRDAYLVTGKRKEAIQREWVLKTYNFREKNTIESTLGTNIKNHRRKQVQMHAVAKHLSQKFESKPPSSSGKCFKYDCCFYCKYNVEPGTVEEFVPGEFHKMVNNDSQCILPPDEASETDVKKIFSMAQCLVHFTYET